MIRGLKWRTANVALVGAIVATALSGGHVAANNFGGPLDAGRHCDTTPSSQCIANGSFHSVCVISASSAHRDALQAAIAHLDSVPPLSVTEYYPACLAYDAHLLDVNVPGNGIIAWTQCASGVTYGGSEASKTRWCVPQEFRWNTAYNYTQTTVNHRKYVACHELSHTLGLRHRIAGEPSATCMRTATINPVYIPPYIVTSGHDQGEIDEHY